MNMKRLFCLSLIAFSLLCFRGFALAQTPLHPTADEQNAHGPSAVDQGGKAQTQEEMRFKLSSMLFEAAKNGNIEAAKRAIEIGANINDTFVFLTPLYQAASYGQTDFVEWAIANGADKDFKNGPSQRTALHEAVLKGRVDTAKKLLMLGAAPNPTNTHGRTPLFYAYMHVGALKDELISVLIAHGADKIEPPSEEKRQEILSGMGLAHDLFKTSAVDKSSEEKPTAKTNYANASQLWAFLSLSIIIGFITTWGLGLAPAFIARYAIYKRPLSKKAANWIAATSCVAFAFIATALHAEEGSRANIAVWIFVFFVSRWIMTRGSEISAKEPTPEHLLLKALTDVSSCFTENEQGLFFSSIKERVKAQIAQAKKKKLLSKSLEGITPEGRVLHMIAGICFDELGTGRFHVYRGVLSLEGRALEEIFLRAIDELEKCGIMPQQEAMDSKRTISEIIKEMG